MSKHVPFALHCSPVLPALLWALSQEMGSSGSRELQRFVLHTLPCRDPSLQESHSWRDPSQLSLCSGTADGVQLLHFPEHVKVIPGVEPDGKRQMEIKVRVLAALRDAFMEAHTH